jgi:hypothetical protein
MTVLLLTEQPHSSYVIPRRTGARERISTRLHAWRLDRALAEGASPDSTASLSLRAHSLISAATRRQLSRGIRRLLRDAERPAHASPGSVPVCRREIMNAEPVLQELAERLIRPGPVDAMGVAQIQLLLRDGSSPVYSSSQAHALEQVVRAAIDALEARPEQRPGR